MCGVSVHSLLLFNGDCDLKLFCYLINARNIAVLCSWMMIIMLNAGILSSCVYVPWKSPKVDLIVNSLRTSDNNRYFNEYTYFIWKYYWSCLDWGPQFIKLWFFYKFSFKYSKFIRDNTLLWQIVKNRVALQSSLSTLQIITDTRNISNFANHIAEPPKCTKLQTTAPPKNKRTIQNIIDSTT